MQFYLQAGRETTMQFVVALVLLPSPSQSLWAKEAT